MADGASIQVKGLREVDQRLEFLGKVAGVKTMRSVMFRAMKPVAEAARANAAAIQRSGALAKSIRRVFLKKPGSSVIFGGTGTRFVVSVAPKIKDAVAIALANLHSRRRKPIRGVFWGHLVEWGFTTRSGKRFPGRGIFTRAISAHANQVIDSFSKGIAKAVDRALKKQEPV